MFCQSCGNVIKEEQTFCRMYGVQVSASEMFLPKPSLVRRASFFSLGVIGVLLFLLLYIFLRRVFFLSDNLIFIILLTTTLILSGMISLLTMEMKELKRTFKKNKSEKKIARLHEELKQESKQIGEKSFVPIFWSITDTTTKDLLPNNKRITGEL
jgi:hypothetical protein